MVSPNYSTVPAPTELSRRISVFVRAAVVLLMVGAQLMMVFGAYRQGIGRGGLFATIAAPFLLMLLAAPETRQRAAGGTPLFGDTDFKFLLVLLIVTPVSVILSLWLTRARHRRVPRKRSP
jgi:hypothetical protein